MLREEAVTRFGSPRVPVGAAAAVLRGRAARAGLTLATASDLDLAAACLVVDAWMAIVGAQTLDRPQRYGPGSVEVVAAALARAAGSGTPAQDVPTLDCPSVDWMLTLADEQVAWASQLYPDPRHVLAVAASDLWAGGPRSPFAAYGSLLAVTSGLV